MFTCQPDDLVVAADAALESGETIEWLEQPALYGTISRLGPGCVMAAAMSFCLGGWLAGVFGATAGFVILLAVAASVSAVAAAIALGLWELRSTLYVLTNRRVLVIRRRWWMRHRRPRMQHVNPILSVSTIPRVGSGDLVLVNDRVEGDGDVIERETVLVGFRNVFWAAELVRRMAGLPSP